jgi:hypothetical protein
MYRAHLGAPSSSQMRRARPAAPLTNATLWITVSGCTGLVCVSCLDLLGLACADRQQRAADDAACARIETAFQSLQGLVWLVDTAGI